MKSFIRESPATAFLLALWVAVFAAMAFHQGGLQAGGDLVTGGIAPITGNLFGSQTSRQLYAGEIWRALTATLIHYSLLHLLGNMWVMYQIGPLVEGWYGSSLFLGLSVGIGWLGNLLAGLAKPWIAAALRGITTIPDYASGGASGLVCGLIALIAVVGWRSRTRFGDFIKAQMVAFLGYVAIMGLVLPNIDNFGHAGGAIVGAAAGFLHKPMLRIERSRAALAAGLLGIIALIGCGLAQYNWASTTARSVTGQSPQDLFRRGLLALAELGVIEGNYRQLASGPNLPEMGAASAPPVSPASMRLNLKRALAGLEAAQLPLQSPEEAQALATVRASIVEMKARRPTPGEIVTFDRALAILKRRAFTTIVTNRPQSGATKAAAGAPRSPNRAGGKNGAR